MSRPSPAPAPSVSRFQYVWEKTWWIFALLFLAANFWAWNRYGEFALLRFYAAFLAVLGASLLLYARRARRLAGESLHWPPVEATILRSEVVRDVQASHQHEFGVRAQPTVYYYPEIEYEYSAEGRRWRSRNLLTVQVNFPKSEAENWVAKYPPGARVLARRHPSKPSLAVLEPGIRGLEVRYRIPFIVGGVFLALGAAGLLILQRLD